jgi:hypothetical protein
MYFRLVSYKLFYTTDLVCQELSNWGENMVDLIISLYKQNLNLFLFLAGF